MALQALFKRRADPGPRHPVQAEFPKLRDADMAATYFDPRIGGDLCDFIRVQPDRVLFALLDVAGRATENNYIVSAAQAAFRKFGALLFEKDDINEAKAMIDLCVELNRTILKSAMVCGNAPHLRVTTAKVWERSATSTLATRGGFFWIRAE